MIEVERISKSYGERVALSDVTFGLPRNSVVGLLGRNAAGKTTTLRILAGVIRPTVGRVTIDGIDAVHAPIQQRAMVGYLPESAPLYPELRVLEHLLFRAAQKGILRRDRAACAKRALSDAGAWHLRDVHCGHLSRGLRQRVGLADAILAEPRVLLLDEPTAGLDPNQTAETRSLIRRLGQSSTVVVSTHILAEVDAMCDSALVIHQGKLVAQGTLAELHALGQSSELMLTLRCSADVARATLGALETPHVEELEPGVVRVTLSRPAAMSLDQLAEGATLAVTRQGIPIREVVRKSASLEQIFAELTNPRESNQ